MEVFQAITAVNQEFVGGIEFHLDLEHHRCMDGWMDGFPVASQDVYVCVCLAGGWALRSLDSAVSPTSWRRACIQIQRTGGP